jgi:hypothetical protein
MLPQRLAATGGKRHLALNTGADKNTPATAAFSYIPASGWPWGLLVLHILSVYISVLEFSSVLFFI